MRQQKGSAGFTLFSTMMTCLCIGLLCSMYGVLVSLVTDIVRMHTAGQVAYWLARSEAVAALRELEKGNRLVPVMAKQVSLGTVTLVSQSLAERWTVYVTGHTSQANDTVEFVYDSGQGKCVLWLDNTEPPRTLN